MPVLSLKDNPPSKPFASSILNKEGTWWVAKVRPRQEKVFAFDLLDQGVDYYLPYNEKKTKRADGKYRKSYLVLFPSYVPFITEEPYRFLNKNRIATILPVKAQKCFREQLNCIDEAYSSEHQIIPFENNSEYSLGESVKVIAGPCKDYSGHIVRINKNRCLVLNIEILGYAFVTISESQVRPIESAQLSLAG